MKRSVSILGSTGSIGCSTLEVLRHLGGREAFRVEALTGASNIALLAAQAREFGAKLAVAADPARLAQLRDALAGSGVEAQAGPEALLEAARRPADWVMAAIVGAAGLAPTVEAARRGATIALANKECLVAAGEVFLQEIAAGGATLISADSEHSGVFQCLDRAAAPERVILTASGGPFRDWPPERMARATPEQAVAHPNWSMGARISIDSASMFNKALEVIEARWLFGLRPDQIEVLVHPQSIVHALVGYADGSMLAHCAPPDMRAVIGYALSWPARAELPVARLDLAALGRLDFAAPDEARFPALRLARAALDSGPAACCVLNAAKEEALSAFIDRRIGFLQMAQTVESALERLSALSAPQNVMDVLQIDAQARAVAREIVGAARRKR